MKVYKVPLYEVRYFPLSYGEVSYIEDILVKKNVFGVSEVLTGYSKIDVIPKSALDKGRLEVYYLNVNRYHNNGHHLFTYSDALVPKNRVTEMELDDYISHYDESKWRDIYESMKVMTSKEKNKVNQKVHTVFGSKK